MSRKTVAALGLAKKKPARKPPARITWRVTTAPGRVAIVIDGLKLISEMNAHEWWKARLGRSRTQKEIVGRALAELSGYRFDMPLRVTITRIAPRRLDPTCNMPSSVKWVEDRLAEFFGVNDRDDTVVKYVPAQRRGEPNQYAVEIVIESVGKAA